VNLVLNKSQSTKQNLIKLNVFKSQERIDLSNSFKRDAVTPKRIGMNKPERNNRKVFN
jgi:hypothetical protein